MILPPLVFPASAMILGFQMHSTEHTLRLWQNQGRLIEGESSVQSFSSGHPHLGSLFSKKDK